MDALAQFSDWMQREGPVLAEQWLSFADAVARGNPGLTSTLVGLSILSGLLSRSVLALLTGLLVTVIALAAVAVLSSEPGLYAVRSCAVAALVLLGLSGILAERRVGRLKAAQRTLMAEKGALQTLLDREITWRQAADEAERERLS